MPPLKQPKSLVYLSHTSFSSWYSLRIYHYPKFQIDLFESLPQNLAEETCYYVLQAAFGVIHHFCAQCDPELDDQVLVEENCEYLKRVLSKLLNSRSRYIDVNFDIDMRQFANFKFETNAANDFISEEELETNKILMTEQFLTENDVILGVSNTINDFILSLSNDNSLDVFNPGLFIIDRQNPEDDLINEPHKISLCWNQPQLLINLVDKAKNLSNLNLIGYEELTDLALEYIAGQIEGCNGLKLLSEITLPKKCFVTTEGIRVLIENLIFLEIVNNQCKMGTMISERLLTNQYGQDHFALKEFSQLESTTSGRIDETENEITGEVQGWNPSEKTLHHLTKDFPMVRSMRLLMDDEDFYESATHLEDLQLQELEIHLLNPNLNNTTGFNKFCVTFANTLTTLKVTILDCISWHSIEVIGKYCSELRLFHIEIWDRVIMDVQELDEERHFEKLQDLKVKCEDYIEPLPPSVMKYFLKCDSSLKVLQYASHLSWLNDENFQEIWSVPTLQSIEMMIIHNVDSSNDMMTGLKSVSWLIEECKNLTVLGNLRSWRGIDHYDPNSSKFYKTESDLSCLKRKIVSANWDLDLELENLDYLYC